MIPNTQAAQGFRPVPRTGVIYVMTEASRRGYREERSEWANLGQGAPETGPLEGAPARIESIPVSEADCEYSPVDGLIELRTAVAELYNARYRKGKRSQYTAENVAICAGGRLALTRAVSTLGRVNIGHFLPDYTAYEELLGSFATFVSFPILLDADRGYEFTSEELREEILGRGLSALLLSNPCNPTGKVIHGQSLAGWVDICRELSCTLIIDEFYSHYIYLDAVQSVSAAQYVEDVEEDPVLIVDGLSKNWRYPGWRVCWTLGPKKIIEGITSAGSFLDGGCARPMQRAAIALIKQKIADKEAAAIKACFGEKRDFLVSGLQELGFRVETPPVGSFYCWSELSQLPEPVSTGMRLFEEALQHNVITVPGVFFDINPGQRRPDRPSRFRHFARFSFGPPKQELERGLNGLKRLIESF